MLIGREVSVKWKIYRKSYSTDDSGEVVTKKLKTIWLDKGFQTVKGQRAFDELMGERYFQSPKPVALVKTLIELPCDEGDIVLDFFAGSATTAQATLELNFEALSKRKFIMVQLPEPVPQTSQAKSAGFDNIAELGEERIRRLIDKLRAQSTQNHDRVIEKLDLGFRVFCLAESNMRMWKDYLGEDQRQYQMLLKEHAVSPLIDGWKTEAVLAEIMLMQGFPLDSQVSIIGEFEPNSVHMIRSDYNQFNLYVCLDEEITAEATARLFKLPNEDIFICLDSALTDELKMRLNDAVNLYVI